MTQAHQVELIRPDDRTIAFRRTVRAPVARVWQAWTDASQLARWYGPDGFSITTHAFDFRIDGEWLFTMHGPDGTDYPNRIRYRSIVEHHRLDFLHDGGEGSTHPAFNQTAVFEATSANETVVTMSVAFERAEDLAHVITNFHADEGGRQTMGRMGAYLEASS